MLFKHAVAGACKRPAGDERTALMNSSNFLGGDDEPAHYDSGPAFTKLMASVGSLLYHWCQLDQVLIEDIRRLRSEGGDVQTTVLRVRGSFSERLAEWRALLSLKSRRNPRLAEAVLDVSNQVERLRQKRNLIAQHFSGASTRREDGEPFISCSEGDRGALNASVVRITQSELTALINEMERCCQRVTRIDTQFPAQAG